MQNLTFQEGLIREHKPEPLEGHTVVVLKRVGEAGERLHAVLEPGSERVRGSVIASMLGRPEVYVAFAVDDAHSRRLTFEEHVRMAEHAYDFHLHFSLWYRASEPEVLVGARDTDPLATVRRKVAETVADEMAEQPWTDVWQSFRATAEQVVRDTRPELAAFARDYGIHIVELKLKARYPQDAIDKEVGKRGFEDSTDLDIARRNAERRAERHRRRVDREDVIETAEHDALLAERRLTLAANEAYIAQAGAVIRSADSPESLRRAHRRLLGRADGAGGYGFAGAGAPRLDAGAGVALPAGSGGIAAVLSDIVALTEPLRDGQRRRIRARLLGLAASLLADDTPGTSNEQAASARAAREDLDGGGLDAELHERLLPLADPDALRTRLDS